MKKVLILVVILLCLVIIAQNIGFMYLRIPENSSCMYRFTYVNDRDETCVHAVEMAPDDAAALIRILNGRWFIGGGTDLFIENYTDWYAIRFEDDQFRYTTLMIGWDLRLKLCVQGTPLQCELNESETEQVLGILDRYDEGYSVVLF